MMISPMTVTISLRDGDGDAVSPSHAMAEIVVAVKLDFWDSEGNGFYFFRQNENGLTICKL